MSKQWDERGLRCAIECQHLQARLAPSGAGRVQITAVLGLVEQFIDQNIETRRPIVND